MPVSADRCPTPQDDHLLPEALDHPGLNHRIIQPGTARPTDPAHPHTRPKRFIRHTLPQTSGACPSYRASALDLKSAAFTTLESEPLAITGAGASREAFPWDVCAPSTVPRGFSRPVWRERFSGARILLIRACAGAHGAARSKKIAGEISLTRLLAVVALAPSSIGEFLSSIVRLSRASCHPTRERLPSLQ
ncbi:hypothetical protein GGG16DRAFT_125107 [Schizophyllum commune]